MVADAELIALLVHRPPCRRHGAGWRHRRDRERQPGIPARRPVLGGELAIGFHVEISLHVPNREEISELWTNSEDPGSKTTEDGILTEVVRDLLIGVSHEADENLFRKKLGDAPVEMEIDAVLILRVLVLEVVGNASDRGKFLTGRRIEKGVSAAAIDCGMTDTEIGEATGIVGTHRDVAGHIRHE